MSRNEDSVAPNRSAGLSPLWEEARDPRMVYAEIGMNS